MGGVNPHSCVVLLSLSLRETDLDVFSVGEMFFNMNSLESVFATCNGLFNIF